MPSGIRRKNLLVPVTCLLLLGSHAAGANPRQITGDGTVEGQDTIRGEHIRLDGALILPQGAKLILEDCTLEIVGEYSRHHSVERKGGILVTRNCTVGGFVNEDGTPIHTVFHVYDGLWEATDTIIRTRSRAQN